MNYFRNLCYMTPTNELSLTPALNEPSIRKRTSIITQFFKAHYDNTEKWYEGFSCKEDDNIRKLYDTYFKPSYGEHEFKSTELTIFQ